MISNFGLTVYEYRTRLVFVRNPEPVGILTLWVGRVYKYLHNIKYFKLEIIDFKISKPHGIII